mmetsp:Transcript_13758/g.14330  ORF Transcript_13758/g.14330 Transcript_13758/m.14330 type:complete len:911 (+) Transcript_13758:74-2806(+)
MSSNRGSYKHLHPDIRNYRDIAPESLSDEALLKLVHDNGKNAEAIKEALEALWNEEPAGQWVTNQKKSKKNTPPPSNERGGRGRGRSAPPGRGDGGRGGRGSGGRSSSVSTQNGRGRGYQQKSETSNNTSTPNQISKVDETEKSENVTETSSSPLTTTNNTATTISTSTITPSTTNNTTSSTTTTTSTVTTNTNVAIKSAVWGSGPSLAQKIREQELAASAPPPPVVVAAPVIQEQVVVESVEENQSSSVAPVSSSSAGHSRRSPRTEGGRGRGRKRGGRDYQPPRSTHIVSEVNDSENNEESNNNNTTNDNNNNNSNDNDNSNNNVEQVVEENVAESVIEEAVETIQNVHIEKAQEEIPESVQNNNDNNNNSSNDNVIPGIVLMSPVRSTNTVTVSDPLVGSPVLKMGRWGASLESTDTSSFQFGSFGNLGHDNSGSGNDGDESPHKIASGLISSLTESQNSWGQQSQLDQNSLTQSDHETENVAASLSVWGNSQSQNDNPDDSYNYDQQVSSSANDNSVHSAPPGLGLGLGGFDTSSVVTQSGSNKSGNNRNSNRSAPGQTRKNDIDNNISRQPQPYYQQVPPGMQPVGGFGIPYAYGFDMNASLQQPSTGYGATTQINSNSPVAPVTNTTGQAVNQNANNNNQNTTNNYNNANNNTAATAGNNAPKYTPGPPGMPAQMGAPYPPYYGNPYYQQAYFYGGAQPQNFYGRGGQAMYPPRPYGADPYAPPMPGYEMYGQPGQFGDAVYGQIPIQPMHPQQTTNTNDNRQNSGKGGNKNVGGPNTQQAAGAVGGVSGATTNVGTAQPDANQAIHSGYGMGGYNAYGRADQSAGWAPYQGGWGQMMFPAAPGVGLGGGYSPMGGIPPQPTNNRHDQTSRGGGGSYNSYGRGGTTSTNGQNDSTGIGGGTSTW